MPIYPKYTFFEMTTQNGFVVSLFANRVARGHSYMLERDGDGLVYRAYRHAESEPYFEFRTPGRSTVQSRIMWEQEVREAATRAWAVYEKAEEARIAAIPRPEPIPENPDAGKTYQQLLEEAQAAPVAPAPVKGKSKKNRVGQ